MSMRCVLCVLVLGSAAASIPSQYAMNQTVYHLNPATAGALPINMDTGDALGDLYFYLGQFLLPLECKNVSSQSRAHFDCDNAERVGNLVVTRVDMQYDSRVTGYSGCNLCNGTDPFTRKPCKKGTYICDCESAFGGGPKCNSSRVGVANVSQMFVPTPSPAGCAQALQHECGTVRLDMNKCYLCTKQKQHALAHAGCSGRDVEHFCPNPWDKCDLELPPVLPWACWASNIPRKTGGFWYSTLTEGQCTGTSGSDCSWQVSSLKTINETCLKQHIITAVETHDTTGCFSSCGAVRNSSSECWIGCFFDTLLGPGAKHDAVSPLGGMSVEQVERTWTDAFLPEAQGGCPAIPNQPLPACGALSENKHSQADQFCVEQAGAGSYCKYYKPSGDGAYCQGTDHENTSVQCCT